ncbi:MAG: hypothetical protein QM489_00340 [Candidatus Izemoplasma sp.]
MALYNITNLSTDLKGNAVKPFSRAIEKIKLIVAAGGSAPIPTITVLDDFYDITQIEMQVDFDQDVIGFDQLDIGVTQNLPGSPGGSMAEWTINSASSFRFVWDHADDGSGGNIDFDVNAAVCTGTVGAIDNIAAPTVNVEVFGF